MAIAGSVPVPTNRIRSERFRRSSRRWRAKRSSGERYRGFVRPGGSSSGWTTERLAGENVASRTTIGWTAEFAMKQP